MKKTLNAAVITCLTLLISPLVPRAHAQSIGLSISPPTVEILLSPNKKVIQTFQLTNQGENTEIVPEIHAVVPSDSAGHVVVDPAPLSPTKIPLIISCDHTLGTPFSIAGGATVPVTLSVEGASSDTVTDTYFALVLKVVPSTPSQTHTLSPTLPAISTLVFVTLTQTGTLPINLEIGNFDPPLVQDSWGVLTITPTIKNTAPVMIRPKGTYTILSPQGKTILSLPFFPNLILKTSERIILGEKMADDGKTPEAISLSWSPHWYDVGPYRLHLAVTTEGGTKVTEIEKVVWLLPIRATIFTALLALSAMTLLIYFKKRQISSTHP